MGRSSKCTQVQSWTGFPYQENDDLRLVGVKIKLKFIWEKQDDQQASVQNSV